MSKQSKTSQEKQRDNRANQLNPNNDRYWKARAIPTVRLRNTRPSRDPHPRPSSLASLLAAAPAT